MKNIYKAILILLIASVLGSCSMMGMMNRSEPTSEKKDNGKKWILISFQYFQSMIPFIQGLKSKAIRSHIISLHKQEVSSGIKLNLYSYNGTVPGQEIRVKVGQQVEVNLKNELDQPVTIHWHGYPVPVDMDGVPGVTQNAVKPGESFQYSFTATVPAPIGIIPITKVPSKWILGYMVH